MKKILFSLIAIIFFYSSISLSQTQSDIELNKTELAEKVKSEFIHAWEGYKKYAWGHDALKPLSKSYKDWYGVSLYMTPIDAFDTMKLMKLDKQAQEAKQLY